MSQSLITDNITKALGDIVLNAAVRDVEAISTDSGVKQFKKIVEFCIEVQHNLNPWVLSDEEDLEPIYAKIAEDTDTTAFLLRVKGLTKLQFFIEGISETCEQFFARYIALKANNDTRFDELLDGKNAENLLESSSLLMPLIVIYIANISSMTGTLQ